ncbi:MAG: GerMN domain-containing protein, partial [Clostridiaceae bacterium]|nr:GerMN domain-containing protein [Clostridiaceae bacterium]
MKRLCLLLAFIVLFTSGCSLMSGTVSETVKLYYAIKGNVGLDMENREIEYKDAKSKYTNTLKELLKGPSDTGKFETSISKDTKVLNVKVEGGNLIVDFSKEFNVFS